MGDEGDARALMRARGNRTRRAAALAAVVLGVLMLCCGAGPAGAAPATGSGTGTGTGSGTAAAASGTGTASPAPQSARLAAALRTDPVYVTDQLPRVVPRSTAPAFAALARTTGVPTYVLVLPGGSDADGSLLGTVHDRLGRDGLYVQVDDMGIAAAKAFGVRAPAQDAQTIALYALPYDAGPLRAFREFTAAIASGPARAARRAAQLEKEYGGTGREIAPAYIDRTDRANQSFVTGIALTGSALGVVLIGWYVRARRHRHRAAGAALSASVPAAAGGASAALALAAAGGLGKAGAKGGKGNKRNKGGTGGGRGRNGGHGGRRVRPPLPAIAAGLLLALAVVLLAPHLFDQTTDSAASPPTRADLTGRVDRVAAGLRQDAVYTDPESPQVLDAARLAELRRRISAFRTGPIRIAVVPQLADDESAGDPEAFVTAVHARLAALGGGARGTGAGPGSGGVYVVADPLTGDIDVYDYGLPLDDERLTFELPASLAYDRSAQTTDDHRLGDRLEQLMAYLAKVPHAAADPDSGPDQTPEGVSDHRLPGVFHGDFKPGLFVGALAAAGLLGLTAAGTGTTAALVRRRRRGPRSAVAEAPSRASAAYLAQAARRETQALAEEFAAAAPDAGGRETAWDCLDTALLLLAEDGGGDRGETPNSGAGTGGGDPGGPDGDGHEPPRGSSNRAAGRRTGTRARAADLAAATVLAQAGRAALAGRASSHCCTVNPLHGAAVPARPAHRCAGCHAAADRGPDALDGRRLLLPGGDGTWLPYEDAPGPLPTAREGIARLIAGTREYTHVR